METMSTLSPSISAPVEASNYDEISMHQRILFSDSLKDLRNLRSQLYSAAEYFELSYTNDGQKKIVMNTLKDYAIKALVNTVDHLGSVSFKVNGILDQKIDMVSGTELRVSCIEQRLRACQEYIVREGICQQSLVITAPKYHKRYIIPAGSSMPESVARNEKLSPPPAAAAVDYTETKQFPSAIRTKAGDRLPSFRKVKSPAPSPRARSSSPLKLRSSSSPSPRPGKHTAIDKRSVSPLPTSTPLARSGSMTNKPTLLKSSSTMRRNSTEPQKSSSMRLHAERIDDKEGEQTSSKTKSFLKSILTRHRSRKDDMLSTYLEEY